MSISASARSRLGKKLLEREARKYKLALSKFDEADYVRVAQ